MRRAGPQDVPWIKGFLEAHLETSMFPLMNLNEHGLNGAHARSISAWIAPDERGVFCLTQDGTMQPQLPDARDWEAAAELVSNQPISACTGETAQARGLLKACGLGDVPMEINRDEPLMRLSLEDLAPEARGHLIPFSEMPKDIALNWRTEYVRDVLGAPASEARQRAAEDMRALARKGRHMCLMMDGEAVAMTGFNAEAGGAVQLGGVYTPPEHRGKAYAGMAIRHHLAQARQGGAHTALLFAATEAAQAAYRKIGFTRIGHHSLCIFQNPEVAA